MIKEGFVLRKMPGINIVMPTGRNVKEFNGALMLNETGAFIFEKLKEGANAEETAEYLAEEYEVNAEKAREDVLKTVASLREAGVVE